MKRKLLLLFLVVLATSFAFLACNPQTPPEPQITTYTISFDVNGGAREIDDITCEAGAAIPNLPSPSRKGFTFLGWFSGSEEYRAGGTMPASNLRLVAKWKKVTYVLTPNNDHAYFGNYPQTLVDDETLIGALTSAAGGVPSGGATEIWYDYGYIDEKGPASYMFYADIEYEGERYRGVYFSKYRPANMGDGTYSYYQEKNGYVTNEVYWFKYETLYWKVLSLDGGYATLMSEKIIDSQQLNLSAQSHGKIHANNYKESSLRTWLNDTFYDTAFDNYDKAIITKTAVVNGQSSTTRPEDNMYLCEDTEDNIWLPCDVDIVNPDYGYTKGYKENDTARQKRYTDYSVSQGLFYFEDDPQFATYWLRSPDWYMDDCCYVVDKNGYANGRGPVAFSAYGVAPILRIKIGDSQANTEDNKTDNNDTTKDSNSVTVSGFHDYQGSVSITPKQETYKSGDKIALTVSAKEHCSLGSVTINDVDVTNQVKSGAYEMTITDDTNIVVKFDEDLTVAWHATVDDFADQINVDGKVYVDFYALWCKPCMEELAPLVDKLIAEGKIKVIKIETSDINKNPYPEEAIFDEYTEKCGITFGSLPFQLLFENGELKKHAQGAYWGGSNTYEAFLKWLGI